MDDWLAQQEELAVQREKAEAGEGRLGLILELSREGLMGTDSEGRITFINDAACRALGYTAGELVGQIIHEAIHHSRSDARVYPVGACPLCHAWQRGEKIRIEDAMLWRKDGRGFPAAYAAAPLLREDRVAGSVVRFIEISERKQQGTEFAGPTTDSHGNADTASASTTARVGVSRRGLPTDGLPVIEGLETLDGLGRVAGNRRLYLRMLRQFVEQQEEAPARIAEALERNEPVVAERLVGAVKGTAGSLGATGVERAAEALEKAIADKGDAAKRATCWREFQSIHEDFVRRLRAALAGLEPRDPP
jgi:PAS domain S-box-containing protein